MSVFVSAGFCCRYSMPPRDYSRVAALEDPPIGYNNFVRIANKESVDIRELARIATRLREGSNVTRILCSISSDTHQPAVPALLRFIKADTYRLLNTERECGTNRGR